MKKSKTFIRNSVQLEARKNEFLLICSILDDLQVNYFLQGGVLLGAIRDNSFIPWDWDVEISVFYSDLKPVFNTLVSCLIGKGFKLNKVLTDGGQIKVDVYGEHDNEVTSYSVISWQYNPNTDTFDRRKLKIPSSYLMNFSKISFCDRIHNVPSPPEKYLKYQYGDWKTPLRTDDKASYLTNQFSGNSRLLNLAKKIMQINK